MGKKINILLASFNGEKYLRAQLNSIFKQTYSHWKLIIRDDGSTDQTIKIVEEYIERYPEKIELLKDGKENLGPTLNFSELMSYSKANYIMFADQDDIWLPHKIDITLNKIKMLEQEYSSSTPLMVFSDLKVVDNNLNVKAESMWKHQKLDPNITKSLYKILAQNVVTGCSMMINQAAKKVACPIPTKNVLHDHWIAINVCKYGKIDYISEPLILYRQHANNDLGALKVNVSYFFNKILLIAKNYKTYREKYILLNFKIVPLFIIVNKIILNLKRLIRI
jgi:glycosyltransferase involved in cell wall biosynthesis